MKQPQDYSQYIGTKINNLTILEVLPTDDTHHNFRFRCVCDCGNECTPATYKLINKGVPKACQRCTSKTNILTAINARTKYPKGTKCSHCGATPIEAKGLCRNCYYRNLKYGRLDYYKRKTPVRVVLTEEERAQKRQRCMDGFNFNPENETAVKWAEMYKNGMSMQQIGDAFGVSRQRVSVVLKGKKK